MYHIRILRGDIRLTEVNLVLLQLIDIAHEMKQAPVTGFLIGHSLLDQHGKVCAPQLSRRHRCSIISITGVIQYLLDQLMNRKLPLLPQIPVDLSKTRQWPFLGFLHTKKRRCRKRHGLLPQPDLCQFLLIQSHHGRFQYCRHGDILIRIIQNPQQIQHILHFDGRKIPGGGLHMGGNALPVQHLGERISPIL